MNIILCNKRSLNPKSDFQPQIFSNNLTKKALKLFEGVPLGQPPPEATSGETQSEVVCKRLLDEGAGVVRRYITS